MNDLAPEELQELKESFDRFRQDPVNRVWMRLRQRRAEDLRRLLSNPDSIDLEIFNREVWVLETGSSIHGKDTNHRFSSSGVLLPEHVAELENSLNSGSIEFHGNSIWGSASRVYGPMLKKSPEEKTEYIRQALRILNGRMSPLEKANEISKTPGFGDNVATGLVMIFHPTEFALYNSPTKTALKGIGYDSSTLESFEKSVTDLRFLLGAEDFIDLDAFLYYLGKKQDDEHQVNYWWVNQGATYQTESSGGYIWAPRTGRDGKTVYTHHHNVTLIKPGDIILHYVNGSIRAVSEAETMAEHAARPEDLSSIAGDKDGYLVYTGYHQFPEPIPLVDLPITLRSTNEQPFTRQGSVKQGYLFPVSKEFVQRVVSLFRRDWPAFMPQGTRDTHVWLFQSNPAYFNLAEEVKQVSVGQLDNWMVSRYRQEMARGDTMLLWQSGPDAGLYAICELTGEFSKGRSTFGQNPAESAWFAEFRYTHILESPIPRTTFKGDPSLRNMQVIKSPQGTNFRVTNDEFQAITKLIGRDQPVQSDYVEPPFSTILEYFADVGFRITERMLQRYHLSLKTRGFVILSGVSGVGKTWLTAAYADAVGAEHLLVPVAPNWTTNEDLLGYFNPLDSVYYDTEFSRFLRRAASEYQEAEHEGRTPRPFHLVLDEMNLARVEYYFAKFLSTMETRIRDGATLLTLGPNDEVLLPPNLLFVGTVNVDETTHGFADKVFDRAQLLELQVDRQDLERHIGDVPYRAQLSQVWDITRVVAPFAYRVVDEIKSYLREAEEMNVPWSDALDEQLLQKVLPKLKGTDLRVGNALQDFVGLAESQFPLSHAKAKEMADGYRQHGFASYF